VSAGNEPAFPCVNVVPGAIHDSYGISKREYFAALALQGLLALPQSTRSPRNLVAEEAVLQADALLEALAK
jgi:hypothetical protein